MDIIADRLGLDPMEVRLKNATKVGDITSAGWIIRSCGLSECIQKAAEKMDWKQKRYEKQSDIGIGMACMIHSCSTRFHPSLDSDFSSASIKVNDDGSVTVMIGTSDMGQGSDTIMAQIAAEELGVKLEDVQIISGDTDTTPECMGGYASRLTFMCGNAVKRAAVEAKKKLFEAAAEKLEVCADDLVARDGKIYIRGYSDRGLIAQLVPALSHNGKIHFKRIF